MCYIYFHTYIYIYKYVCLIYLSSYMLAYMSQPTYMSTYMSFFICVIYDFSVWVPSIPFPSLRVPDGGVPIPLNPPLPFPPLPLPLPPGVPPLNHRGSGEHYKLPQWGLRRSPSRQTIWCISGPKGAALLATAFVHFIKINVIFCDFEAEGSIKFSLS